MVERSGFVLRAVKAWDTGLFLALALLAMGLVQSGIDVLRPALDVYEARSWVEVPVQSGRISALPFHGMEHIEVDYSYVFDGKQYRGNRYAFTLPSALHDDDVEALKEPATCFVDPAHPESSVWIRDIPLGTYRMSGVIYSLAALLLLLWSLAWRRADAPGKVAAAARAVPSLVTRGTALLGGAWYTYHTFATGPKPIKLMILAVVVGATGLLWPSEPRLLRAGAACMVGLAVQLPCCGCNPFIMSDITTDDLHDPGYRVSFALAWFSAAAVLVVIAYMAVLRAYRLALDDRG